MAIQSWHDKPQEIEVDRGLAREGSPKKLVGSPDNPLRIHSGMLSATRGVGLGAAPTGVPLDDEPLATDPVKQHGVRKFPVPPCHSGTPSGQRRGPDQSLGSVYDPQSAVNVGRDAVLSGSTKIPDQTTEE